MRSIVVLSATAGLLAAPIEEQKIKRAEDQKALLFHYVPAGDRSTESFLSSFLLIFCFSQVPRITASAPDRRSRRG
jgi:hypothetical protein